MYWEYVICALLQIVVLLHAKEFVGEVCARHEVFSCSGVDCWRQQAGDRLCARFAHVECDACEQSDVVVVELFEWCDPNWRCESHVCFNDPAVDISVVSISVEGTAWEDAVFCDVPVEVALVVVAYACFECDDTIDVHLTILLGAYSDPLAKEFRVCMVASVLLT